MSLQKTLAAARKAIPNCAFAGCIDIETGMMVSLDPLGYLDAEVAENLAAAVVNALESKPMLKIEDAFRQTVEDDDGLEPYFRELVILTEGRVHAFLRMADSPSLVACFVTEETADPAGFLGDAKKGLGSKPASGKSK